VLASVGDDGMLCIWDSRAGSSPQLSARVSQDEVLTVDWSRHMGRTLATAGKDKEVRIWDLRSLASPSHALCGHKGDVVAVHWAPFREALLASSSSDARLHLWDLHPKQAEEPEEPDGEADSEAPELLFAHGGHESGVSSFAWSEVDDFLLCSVAEDNSLQIWQPSTVFYLADSEEEVEEPEAPVAKRPRVTPAPAEGASK